LWVSVFCSRAGLRAATAAAQDAAPLSAADRQNAQLSQRRGLQELAQEHWIEALRWLEVSLDAASQPLDESQKTETLARILDARSHLGGVALRSLPEAREVQVDGQPALRDRRGVVLLEPGKHRLSVLYDAGAPYTLELESTAGQLVALRIDQHPTESLTALYAEAKDVPEGAAVTPAAEVACATPPNQVKDIQAVLNSPTPPKKALRVWRTGLSLLSLGLAAGFVTFVSGTVRHVHERNGQGTGTLTNLLIGSGAATGVLTLVGGSLALSPMARQGAAGSYTELGLQMTSRF
jgi:hypothetical protein